MPVEKRWIICIDVPLWVSALGSNQDDWSKLTSLLDEVAKPDNQLLYRDEIRQLAKKVPDNMWVLYSKLSKLSTVAYPTDANAFCIKSSPDVTTGIGDAGQKAEVEYQMAFLYKRDGFVPRPVKVTQRVNASEVSLTKDGKNPRKVYVCGTDNGDVQRKIVSLQPVLNQAKHFQFERNLGKGKIASVFSAYDKQNEEPARALLRDAFLHYIGEDLPACELWAKDEAHGCYVRFMHSGNNQYHGYDEKDLNKVPQNIQVKREVIG